MRCVHGLFCLVLCVLGFAPRAAALQVDFAKLAEQFLERNKIQGLAEGEAGVAQVIESAYTPAVIGALELRFPREFTGDKSAVEAFKSCITATLQVHRLWLDWLASTGPAADAARKDIDDALKFVKGAKINPAAAKSDDFLTSLSGYAAVQPVFQRLRDGFFSGSSLGITPRGTKQQVILVAPTRLSFLELAGVLGRLVESGRSMYWNESLLNWTEFGWNQVQVMATMYPPLQPEPGKIELGTAMDDRDPTGLLENAAQRAAVTLCWHCFGNALDPAFEFAIAHTVVIDIYGQNNTRAGGSGRTNDVAGMEVFVPGGNSAGGALPPGNADSPWREGGGKDYFVRKLRDGLKAGSKNGAKSKEDKGAYFQLQSDDTTKKTFVRAPFLGTPAQGKELPPQNFLSDYLEFFRAYKAGFVHFVREAALPKKGESTAKFALLLRNVSEAGGAASFEELVLEVYSVPYSSTDLSKDCLEQRFLAFLGSK